MGEPVALRGDADELGAAFSELARVVAEEVAPLVDTGGCSARLLARMEAAVGEQADAG